MRLPYLAAVCLPLAGCGEPLGADAAPCDSAIPYTLGGTVAGRLENSDCKDPEDHFGDVYAFSVAERTGFQATVSGASFSPNLLLYQGTVANAAAVKLVVDEVTSANAFIPAGSYLLVVASANGKGGNYKLTTGPANTNGCAVTSFTFRGGAASGTITADDCTGSGNVRQDIYEIWLDGGSSVTVTGSVDRRGGMLFRTGGANSEDLVARSFPQPAGGSATITFTAPQKGWYRVHMLNDAGTTTTANYQFTVD